MTTKFYQILTSDLPAHQDHFLACHQQNMPGNQLAVLPNVAGTEVLVKVNCDMPVEEICVDCPIIAIHTFEEAKTLLQTPEWLHVVPE